MSHQENKSVQILIFGANGWIGTKVYKYLTTELGLTNNASVTVFKSGARADDIEAVKRELIRIPNITHIMSFIGRTHGTYENEKIGTIDYLEKPGKLTDNVRDNLFSPIALALLCKERNIHFTYLGTGCIFEYDAEHPFAEEVNGFAESNKPNFFGSSYSIVKGFTDQLMHLLENTVLNVRIRMPITHEVNDRNFITKITNYSRVCSIPNSMTVLNELIPIMVDMALSQFTGTVNLTNPGLISHNEILEMYREIVDPAFTWNNFSIQDQNQILLSKRSNNFLDTSKLQELYPKVKPIKESVREMLVLMHAQRKKID